MMLYYDRFSRSVNTGRFTSTDTDRAPQQPNVLGEERESKDAERSRRPTVTEDWRLNWCEQLHPRL